jgi:hypothetical protein
MFNDGEVKDVDLTPSEEVAADGEVVKETTEEAEKVSDEAAEAVKEETPAE